MDTIETQLLPGKDSRFLNAKVVKEVETTMKELKLKVVIASNISKTSEWIEKNHAYRETIKEYLRLTSSCMTRDSTIFCWSYKGVGKTE